MLTLIAPCSPVLGTVPAKTDGATLVTITPQQDSEELDPVPGLPAAVVTKGPKKPLHVVLVDKSRQRLYLFLYHPDGRINLIRSFPCSTGRSTGDKIKEGDRRTPEGVYFFTKAFYDSKITIFGKAAFHLNYPDPFDQAEGKEGNGIYLHGTNRPLGSRDTNGCVVMNNPDLDFVRQRIQLHDTPIIISPQLDWISQEDLNRARDSFLADIEANWNAWSNSIVQDTPDNAVHDLDKAVLLRQNGRTLIRTPVTVETKLVGWKNIYLDGHKESGAVLASLWMPRKKTYAGPVEIASSKGSKERMLTFLQGWVKAWESRDIKEYMSYYSRKFRAYGMDYRKWRDYKKGLAGKYEAIDVEIHGIKIDISGSRAVVTFRQKYYSDKFQDDGIKVLKLSHEKGGWKIRREDWTPLTTMEAKR